MLGVSNEQQASAVEAWWLECCFRDIDGQAWKGILLEQGSRKDDGALVVITDRAEASTELAAQGSMLWVVVEPGGPDRLVPLSRLEHVELVAVA